MIITYQKFLLEQQLDEGLLDFFKRDKKKISDQEAAKVIESDNLSNNVKISQIDIDDIDEMLKLEDIFDESLRANKSELLEPLLKKPSWSIKATIDSQFVGYISAIDNKDKAYIQTLVVNPEHLNKGIGKLLINNLISKIKDDHVKIIELSCQDKIAYSMYIKLGFKETGFINYKGSKRLIKYLY